jgi:dTDP-4-amino-4,6-dideoxygalactose transaminase
MSTLIRVPQIDLRVGYLALKRELDEAVARVLDSGWYILGSEVAAFEAEFAAYIGVGHAVGVANGTDALALALSGLGVGAGDAVATVSHTAVATVAAIEMAGATPVLVDIDPLRFTLDADALEQVMSARPIRAVVVVHLYGQSADIERIVAIARRFGAAVIEDCSQAHGATCAGRRLGRFGDVAAYSLYPTKNLGALGDGGIVATDDPALAERIAALRQYGWRERYVSEVAGVNSRLDEIQAAVLRVKLQHLEAHNGRRRAIAARYDRALADSGLQLPARAAGCEHVFHQYVIRSSRRTALQQRLRDAGIASNVHYPVPIHLQPAYRDRIATAAGGLPHTEAAAASVLSLPMYPQLADAQVDAVCDAVLRAADGH